MFIKSTQSLCPACLDKIPADVISEDGEVYLVKECPGHGTFKVRHPWSNMRHYDAVRKINSSSLNCASADGLIIHLNSTCNQNCPFCFSMANEHVSKEPSLKEIAEKITNFRGSSIYLCGGEPTLRGDLLEIIALVRKCGYKPFLFTNGKKLIEIEYVRSLKKAGLYMVILQFDTLDEERSRIIRGERLVGGKLAALANLKKANIPAYLFVMLVKETNLDEVGKLLQYALDNNDTIKIINFNPVWELGRLGRHGELGASGVIHEIEKQTSLRSQDFIECTLFSHYFFELARKITKRGGRKHPMCEMRCYLVSSGSSFIPFNKIFDLGKINECLKGLNEAAVIENAFKKYHQFLSRIIHLSFLMISNKRAVKMLIKYFSLAVFGKLYSCSRLNFVSVIVGTFHTEKTIDFDMVDTCNLSSEFGQEKIPSCLRQVYYLRSLPPSANSLKC